MIDLSGQIPSADMAESLLRPPRKGPTATLKSHIPQGSPLTVSLYAPVSCTLPNICLTFQSNFNSCRQLVFKPVPGVLKMRSERIAAASPKD
jgi:hypothetical protein